MESAGLFLIFLTNVVLVEEDEWSQRIH